MFQKNKPFNPKDGDVVAITIPNRGDLRVEIPNILDLLIAKFGDLSRKEKKNSSSVHDRLLMMINEPSQICDVLPSQLRNIASEHIFRGDSKLTFFSPLTSEEFSVSEYVRTLIRIGHHLIPKYTHTPLSLLGIPAAPSCDGWALLKGSSYSGTSAELSEERALDAVIQLRKSHPFSLREFLRSEFALLHETNKGVSVKEVIDGHSLLLLSTPKLQSTCPLIISCPLLTCWEDMNTPEMNFRRDTTQITLPHKLIADLEVTRLSDIPTDSTKRAGSEVERLLHDAGIPPQAWVTTKVFSRTGIELRASASHLIDTLCSPSLQPTREESVVIKKQTVFYSNLLYQPKLVKPQIGTLVVPLKSLHEAIVSSVRQEMSKPEVAQGLSEPFHRQIPVLGETFLIRASIEALDAISPRTKIPHSYDGSTVAFGPGNEKTLYPTLAALMLSLSHTSKDFVIQNFFSLSNRSQLSQARNSEKPLRGVEKTPSSHRYEIEIPLPLLGIDKNSPLEQLHPILKSFIVQIHGRIPLTSSHLDSMFDYVLCRGSDGVSTRGFERILKSYKVRSQAGRLSTALGWLREYAEYSEIPKIETNLATDCGTRLPPSAALSILLKRYPTLEPFIYPERVNTGSPKIVISAKVRAQRDEFITIEQIGFQPDKANEGGTRNLLRDQFNEYQASRGRLLFPFEAAIKEIVLQAGLDRGRFLRKLKTIGQREIIGSDGELLAKSFQHLVNMYLEVRKQLYYQETELSRTVLGRRMSTTWKHPTDKSLPSIVCDLCGISGAKKEKIIDDCVDFGRSTIWVDALSGFDQSSLLDSKKALATALQEATLHTTGRSNITSVKTARQKSIYIKNYEGTHFGTLHSLILIEANTEESTPTGVHKPAQSTTTCDEQMPPMHELADTASRHAALKYFLRPRRKSSGEDWIAAPEGFVDIVRRFLGTTCERFLEKAPSIPGLSADERLRLLKDYQEYLHKLLVELFTSLQTLPPINEATGTANFGSTPLTMEDGTVVAECFGHLYSIVVALSCEAHHRSSQLRGVLKIGSQKKHFFDSDKAVTEVFGKKPSPPIASLFPSLFAQNTFSRPYYTLTALDNITSDVTATLEERITVLKEAALQSLGIRDFDPLSSVTLEGKAVRRDGKGLVWLNMLQLHVRRDITRLTKKTSKSQNTPSLVIDEKKRILRVIFEDLDIPTETAFFALCALGEYDETRTHLRTIRAVRNSLRKESDSTPSEKPTLDKTKTPPPSEVFMDFLSAHSERFSCEELTEIGRERLAQLFHQLCFHYYQGSLEKIKEELESISSSCKNSDKLSNLSAQILREVLPILSLRYEQIENFQVPESLPFTPLPHQIATCIGGLYHQKPIFVLGPGTGKTKLIALYVKALLPPTTLLLTTGANRADTALRIAEDLHIPALTIDSHFWKKPLDEQKGLLATHTLAVASHDTIRILERRYPAAHTLLADWVSPGLKALDEVQHTDNSQNKRTTAIANLRSKHTIALSATPVLHRPERVATLLHLTLPERFPNPRALEESFRRDPNLGTALFQQHATCFKKEDIALPFRPFSEADPKIQIKEFSPRIATLHTKVHDYYLSAEHSMIYCNLVFNPRAWADEQGLKWRPLCQVNWLRRLTTNPELLGAHPAYSLRNAIKSIAIPALEKGEKVLLLSQRLAPLAFLQSDPDFTPFVQHRITGRTPSTERAAIMKAFEENEEAQIVFGQFRAAGQGFNCRGIAHVIFADLPPTVSEVIQGMHRHHRIITESDLRFALSDIFVHFVQPKVDPRILADVKDKNLRDILNRETVHEYWLTKMLDRIDDYKMLTGQLSKINIPDSTSVTTVVSHLAKAQAELEKARLKFKIFDDRNLSGCFYRYRSKEKKAWRSDGLRIFVKDHLPLLQKSSREVRVALLPGPEALEIPAYLEAGILPKNIDGYEASRVTEERLTCREELNFFGSNFSESRIEEALLRAENPYDTISIDSHGPLTATLFGALVKINAAPITMLLKNTLVGRDTGETNKLLRSVKGSRQKLDYWLLSLFGTQANSWAGTAISEVILTSERVREISMGISESLSNYTGIESPLLGDILSSIALSSPLVRACSQFRYKNGGGRPLLSTFAVLEKWPTNLTTSTSAIGIQNLIRALATDGTIVNTSLSLTKDRQRIHIESSNSIAITSVELEWIVQAANHFINKTPDEFRIHNLLQQSAKELVLR